MADFGGRELIAGVRDKPFFAVPMLRTIDISPLPLSSPYFPLLTSQNADAGNLT